MGPCVIGHSHWYMSQLLRRVYVGPGRHDDGPVRNDGTPTELAPAGGGGLYAMVVAPLAGVKHGRLAGLQTAAMAAEGAHLDGIRDAAIDLFGRILPAANEL